MKAKLVPMKLVPGIVGVVVLIGVGVFLGYKFFAPGSGPTNTLVAHGDAVEKILKISELATIGYHVGTFDTIQHRSDKAKINVFGDADYDLFKFWQGTVKAGIDLDKSHLEIVPAKGDTPGSKPTVVITLPPAEILSAEPDSKDGFVYFINWVSTFGTKPTDVEKTSWANEGPAKLKASAKASGIEQQAADRAKEILTGYVSALGYDVTFATTPVTKSR